MSDVINKKHIFQLLAESNTLEQMLIESHGELTPEIEEMLTIKDVQLPEKIDGYAFVIDRMDSVSDFYKRKAEMFMRLSKSATSVSYKCKENLKSAMALMNVDELSGFDVRFKLVKSNPSCVIEDENKIDASYKVTETVISIDKKRIAQDLKLGVPVDGARLEQGTSLRTYANSPNAKKKEIV